MIRRSGSTARSYCLRSCALVGANLRAFAAELRCPPGSIWLNFVQIGDFVGVSGNKAPSPTVLAIEPASLRGAEVL
jgi:hypothetical protein